MEGWEPPGQHGEPRLHPRAPLGAAYVHPWRRAHPSLRSGSDRQPRAAKAPLTRPSETILPMGHGGGSAEARRPPKPAAALTLRRIHRVIRRAG